MSEEDFIVGYTIFKGGGFRTRYQHFDNLEVAKMFTSNVNLKDTSKIYVPLELYEKQIDQLANGIRVLGTNPDITTEEIIKEFTEKPISEEYMKKFKSSYISKDEVLKALGYEENDEEYERLYNKEELILSLIRTINEECDRLEDIEDQKVEVAVDFIEEKRDKYWQDEINNKIKELEELPNNQYIHLDYIKQEFKKLLEE